MTMRTLALTACLATIGGAGLAQGADKTLNDVRLGVGFGIAFNEEVEFKDIGIKDDVDSDTLRIGVSYVRSFQPFQSWGAFFAGGEVAYEQVDGDGEGDLEGLSFDSTLLSAGIQGGYAYALPSMPELHFEAALGVGLVVGTMDRDFDGPQIGTGLDGTEFKFRVSALYTLSNGFQAGLDLVYLIARDLDSAKDDAFVGDMETSQDGLSLGIVIGYHM